MTETWAQSLQRIKEFWIARYHDCENDKQREEVRQNLARALADKYGEGCKATDPDIIEEVNFELNP